MDSFIKQTLFSTWHPLRWMALILGLSFAILAVWNRDLLTGFFGTFFLFQAFTNRGCLGSQACAVPSERVKDPGTANSKDKPFTEIKDS